MLIILEKVEIRPLFEPAIISKGQFYTFNISNLFATNTITALKRIINSYCLTKKGIIWSNFTHSLYR